MKHSIILFLILSFFSCEQHVQNNETVTDQDNDKDVLDLPNTYQSASIDSSNDNETNLVMMERLNDTIHYPLIYEDSIIGIGIVTTSDGSSIYKIYNEKNNVIALVEGRETVIKTQIDNQTFGLNDTLNPFRPRLFVPNSDYFSLALDCISIDSTNFKVIINRQTGRTGLIKRNDKNFKFETIDEFVKNWTSLGLDFNRTRNPLRANPSIKSDTIRFELENNYSIWRGEVINMKGDWMEIQTIENEKGWILWRNGNQILIRMYYAC